MKPLVIAPAAVIAALIAAAAQCGEATTPAAAPKPYQFVFEQKCAACHGPDGRGEGALYRKLNVKEGVLDLTRNDVAQSSDRQIEDAIRMGNGKMPAFGQKFHDDVIHGLARYVRSLTEGAQEVRGPGGKDRHVSSK